MKDLNKIIEEYKKYAFLHWTSSREGDYKTANKIYSKLTKLYKSFLNSKELSEKILPQLLNDSNYSVQMWAAAHCLSLGIYEADAINRLENISRMNSNAAPSFEAKMTLQVWKEKGRLTF